jgi:hypothetical protein
MDKRTETTHLIAEEVDNLPQGFDALSKGFLVLVAALRLHGFSIVRADEAKAHVTNNDNLWLELQPPSVWVQSRVVAKIRYGLQENIEHHGTPEYIADSNKVITADLSEQRRLLVLLDEFYQTHGSRSVYTRLITETDSQGGFTLKPQGASIRIIMDEATQKTWYAEFRAEMLAFGDFLAGKM